MTGDILDNLFFAKKSISISQEYFYIDTDYGKLRVFDTGGEKPSIITVPDGPNVIEHQFDLVRQLSKNFRVICFEYPGLGSSLPNRKFNYSFKDGAETLLQVMSILNVKRTSLLFSCSNGFYAIQAAINDPEKFSHLFLSQTPSTTAMMGWTEKAIPAILKWPFLGQTINKMYASKFAEIWYQYALPKGDPKKDLYATKAKQSLRKGGCFCLSSLVLGLSKEKETMLHLKDIPTTMVWGMKDFTHRQTNQNTILDHIRHCEIIDFNDSGHFPELEHTSKYVTLINERTG